MLDAIEVEANLLEMINDAIRDGIAPTNCPEGCVVELDGKCPHNFKSLILELGLI